MTSKIELSKLEFNPHTWDEPDRLAFNRSAREASVWWRANVEGVYRGEEFHGYIGLGFYFAIHRPGGQPRWAWRANRDLTYLTRAKRKDLTSNCEALLFNHVEAVANERPLSKHDMDEALRRFELTDRARTERKQVQLWESHVEGIELRRRWMGHVVDAFQMEVEA